MKLKIFSLVFFLFSTSCTIYRSPQRKEFETEFKSESSQFRIQNLNRADCSHQSVRSKASSKRLITVLQNSTYSTQSAVESEFLWEYIVESESIYESDNLKGVYCVYEEN